MLIPGLFKGLFTRQNPRAAEPVLRQVILKEFLDFLFVFDDQDRFSGHNSNLFNVKWPAAAYPIRPVT
jgi:hypothetical protein